MHVLSFSLVGLVFPYVSLAFWPLLFLLRFFRLLIPSQTQQFLLAIVNINFPDGGEKSICSFKKKTRPMPLSSNWLATLSRSLTERANLSILVTISLSPSRKYSNAPWSAIRFDFAPVCFFLSILLQPYP
jgi:hypothetical protein